MTTQVLKFAAFGAAVAALTLIPAAAGAANGARSALETAEAVIRATDRAPVIESHEGASIAGRAIYAGYSDRRTRISATYLEGKLVQGTVDTTLYAANGACFKHEQLPHFVGLSHVATSLLPPPIANRPVSYRLSGHTLHWREPATKQHSVERGAVEFDAYDRITGGHTAPYVYGHDKAPAQTLRLSYPSKLPRSVPGALPKPACKSSADRTVR